MDQIKKSQQKQLGVFRRTVEQAIKDRGRRQQDDGKKHLAQQ